MKYHTRLAGWLLMIAGAGLCLGGRRRFGPRPKERANRDAHGEVLCMAITPDGKTLATGTRDRITLWDVATGKELHTLKRHKFRSGDTPLVLLCPTWKQHGTARTVKPGTVILHSRATTWCRSLALKNWSGPAACRRPHWSRSARTTSWPTRTGWAWPIFTSATTAVTGGDLQNRGQFR
jgi:WD40 repeat protein